jgi:CubicO group peptidase (beta-lactamase class C family)
MPLPDAALRSFLEESFNSGEFHGAVWLVAEGNRVLSTGAFGYAVPDVTPTTTETVFDLASLTKPLVTGLLIAKFIEEEKLSLDEPIAARLPVFQNTPYAAATLKQVVSHSAGFPAWKPFYALAPAPDAALDVIACVAPAYKAGTRVIYSDLGYILLGKLLEALTATRLDTLFQKEIASPLGLKFTGYLPSSEILPRVAATELGNVHERTMIATMDFPPEEKEKVAAYDGWRTALVHGAVHDGNAHFFEGISGHAGLFAPVADVFTIARQFLPGSRLFNSSTLNLFTISLTPGLDEERSVGWMLASTKNSTAGEKLSPRSFGHLGFTGTSLWIDPATDRVYILLTNRTYPIRPGLNAVRRTFNTLGASLPTER